MAKKRRIYKICIALLLCFLQTAGIAMYGQNRPRAAAKRIHRQLTDTLNTQRKPLLPLNDSLDLEPINPALNRTVATTDSLAIADSIAAENKKKLLEMTASPELKEQPVPTDSIKKEVNKKYGYPTRQKRLGWPLSSPVAGKSITASIGNFPSFTADLPDAHTP